MSNKIIIIVIVFVILVVSVLVWLTIKEPAPSIQVPVPEEFAIEKETEDFVSEELAIKITDCGALGPDNPEDEKKVMGCWELKFKECIPAKVVFSVDLYPLLGEAVVYHYEIIGPENSLCAVRSQFLENPNSDFVNKEMICNYDNSKDFNAAVEDFIGRCNGPLYDLLTEGMQLHERPDCDLKLNVIGISQIKGVSSLVTVSGFKGNEDEVIWQVLDTNVATISLSRGEKVFLKSVDVGSTQLIVADTSVGPDCFLSIPVTTFE